MIMSIPDEMYKYMDTSGRKPIILRSAPEYIKKKARKINEIAKKIEGSEYFIIEE